MIKHRYHGFTIVELIVVIVVIAIIVGITTVSYRSSQRNARDAKRQSDVLVLKAALEEYRSEKGDFPEVVCTTGSGGNRECWNDEVWTLLKSEGYISKIPATGLVASPRYGYLYLNDATVGSRYGIFVPRESGSCKTGQRMLSGWWSSLEECSF